MNTTLVSVKIASDLWSVPLSACFIDGARVCKIVQRHPIWYGAKVQRREVKIINGRTAKLLRD